MSSEAEDSRGEGSSIVVSPEAIQEVCEWLNLKMRTGRYSIGLALELAWHMVARCYHVHTIYDEIGILEGVDTRTSRTVKASQFRREPLIGFWHKHHFQPYFMAKNLLLETINTDIFEKSIEKYVGHNIEDFSSQLAYDMTIGVYAERSRRGAVTGQWIVYEQMTDGTNYYINLGSHGNKSTDRALRDKIERHKELDRQISADS